MPSPVNEPVTPLVVALVGAGAGADSAGADELEVVVLGAVVVVDFLVVVEVFFFAVALGVATAAALCCADGAAAAGVLEAEGTEEAAEAPARVESPLSLN